MEKPALVTVFGKTMVLGEPAAFRLIVIGSLPLMVTCPGSITMGAVTLITSGSPSFRSSMAIAALMVFTAEPSTTTVLAIAGQGPATRAARQRLRRNWYDLFMFRVW